MNEWQKPDIGRYYILGIIVLVVLFVFGWLYYDHNRNKPVYTSTNGSMANLEKRIQSAEQRIDSMQRRIDQNQKTIESVGRRISTGTGLTYEIIEGTGRAEKRIESAISRTERIQAIIEDIERKNK